MKVYLTFSGKPNTPEKRKEIVVNRVERKNTFLNTLMPTSFALFRVLIFDVRR